ncbi:MAG: hypothetical protein NT018_07260 [Armatimonadetes bacterium]|nr:hypothetical protein [Armatimonadota bacterium]
MGLKTLFIISISTARMIFPGMPILPGQEPGAALDPKMISKSVTMSLTSANRTDEIPSVKVTVPEGLKVGPFVKLRVEFPKPAPATAVKPADSSKMKTKIYWGGSETIPSGQPKIEDAASDTSDTQQSGSFAYWPIGYSGEKVPGPNSKLAGKYSLTSNYCGETSITLDNQQSFLEGINLIGLGDTVDTAKPIKISWKKIPRAVGYIVNAFGGNDKESIYWTSCSDPDKASEIETSPVTKDVTASYLSKKLLLKPDTTSCTIPAGVFKGSTDIMITVTAVGTDKIQTGDDMDTQVLVRSIASAALTVK